MRGRRQQIYKAHQSQRRHNERSTTPLLSHDQTSSASTSSSANMHNEASSPTIAQTQSQDESKSCKALNRKMDIALLPFLSLLYLANGLDRSNIGNAETQGERGSAVHTSFTSSTSPGFSRDIGASPDDLNLAVSLFYVPFVLLQPPSAAIGSWLGARHWITIMMVL